MHEINLILASIVPTFGIVVVGWLCRKIGLWDKHAMKILNNYAYYIALPALIFMSLYRSNLGANFSINDIKFVAGTLLTQVAVFAVAFLVVNRLNVPKDVRLLVPVLITYGNTAYVGIPYATNTFGIAGTSLASVVSVLIVVTILFLSVMILSKNGHQHDSGVKTFLLLPFLWAVIAGLVWTFAKFPQMPSFVSKTLDVFATSASPIALLAVGAFDYDVKLTKVPYLKAIVLGALKVFVPGALTYVVLRFILGVSGLQLAIGTSMGAVSVGLTAFVLADQYNANRTLTSATMVASSVFSFLALTTVSYLWFSTSFFK